MKVTKLVPLWIAALMVMMLVVPMIVPAAPVFGAESSVEPERGDINGDFEVDMMDAYRLYRYASGDDVQFTINQFRRADMNGDGDLDMRDAHELYRISSGEDHTIVTTPTTATTTQSTTTTTAAPTTTVTTTTTTVTDSSSMSTTATTTPTGVKGIDVSYSQGAVDWSKVKESGMEFALIRCGYGQDLTDQDDDRWDEYTAACEEYDIPYGAYLFCYARSAEEAAGEAQHALRLLEGKNLTLPVFLDMEYSGYQGDLSNDTYAAIATVFCETLSAAGYKVGVYANYDWWTTRLTDECFDRWYRWVAQYNSVCDYTDQYHIWQYTEYGTTNGIGGYVDMNICYLDPKAF